MLRTLVSVLSPPKHPRETGSAEGWKQVEARLSTMLPGDYRAFITKYGSGCIDGFLWVDNPFTQLSGLNLFTRSSSQLDALRVLRGDIDPELVPYPVFPERGGVLPWGGTDNGDVLYWITRNSPSEWIVAVGESRGPMWEEYDCSMTEFLVKLLSKEIRSDIFPEEFPSDSPGFRVVTSV